MSNIYNDEILSYKLCDTILRATFRCGGFVGPQGPEGPEGPEGPQGEIGKLIWVILLPIGGAILGDGTPGSAAPALSVITTSNTTDPQLRLFCLKFSSTVDEHCFWSFRMLSDYSSGGRLKIQFYMDSNQADNTKTVQFEASLIALTPNADADEMTSLDATNDSGGWVAGTYTLDYANPALDDRLCEVTIDLSSNLNGLAAGDKVILSFKRDVSDDSAVGDAVVTDVVLEFNY